MNRSFYNNIKKIDKDGKSIKEWKGWKKEHPDELYFDSMLEYVVHNYLQEKNINFTYQPDSIELIPKKKVKEIKDITRKKVKSTVIKETNQSSISYTPDFYLNDLDIYLETKGYLKEDGFRLRWRLFKYNDYKGYIIRNIPDLELVLTTYKK